MNGKIQNNVNVLCFVTQSRPTLCDPMNYSPPGSSFHEDSPGQNTRMGFHALLQGIFPTQGSNPGLLLCREPPGKPRNTGVGGLSLLQEDFPTQESNQGLSHGRQILYQLSYLGSPVIAIVRIKLRSPGLGAGGVCVGQVVTHSQV